MSGIADLVARMGQLGQVPEEVLRAASPKIAGLIDEQFSAGVDPYGQPWAPLRPATLSRGRTPPPLTDTGAMHAGIQVTVSGSELAARVDEPGIHHQYGTANMARRRVLPDAEGGLPDTWGEALNEALDERLAAVMR